MAVRCDAMLCDAIILFFDVCLHSSRGAQLNFTNGLRRLSVCQRETQTAPPACLTVLIALSTKYPKLAGSRFMKDCLTCQVLSLR